MSPNHREVRSNDLFVLNITEEKRTQIIHLKNKKLQLRNNRNKTVGVSRTVLITNINVNFKIEIIWITEKQNQI